MDWSATVDHIKPGLVRVFSGGSMGSGFRVEGGFIVTAQHVLASPTAIEVETSEGARTAAQLVNNANLASVDLAVLRCSAKPGMLSMPLGQFADAKAGHEVLIAGYPLDESMPLTFHKAMIAFIGQRSFPPFIKRTVNCLQLDGSINLGNSGGPVVSETGSVLGIINARYGNLTSFLDAFSKEQIESRQMMSSMGIGGAVQMGALQIDGKTYKQFDTQDAQNALIDIVSMLKKYTNVGIGWAVSSEYVTDVLKRL